MPEEIKRVYEQWKNALVKTDLSTLEKLYADNFLWTNNIGITCNKMEYLFKISSGNVRYISWSDKNLKTIVENDKAIVKTTKLINMLAYGQAICTERDVTATFQLRDGEWLLSKIEEGKNVS